jgi:hypothetical protein
MIERRHWAFRLCLFFFFGMRVFAQNESTEEIYLTLRYNAGNVNGIISALTTGDSLYLPVRGMFSLLHVSAESDSGVARLHGFYIEERRTYAFDYTRHRVIMERDTIEFLPEQFLKSDLDLYLTPAALQRVFRLKFDVDLKQLLIAVATEDKLPVAAEQEREGQQLIAESKMKSFSDYPLLSDRKKPLFGGGVIDYTLSGTHSEGLDGGAATVRIGTQLLGGEFNGTFGGSEMNGSRQQDDPLYKWKYVFDNSNFLTQASLGVIDGSGLTTSQFRGIQLSSEPAVPRTTYQKITLRETVKPDWTVELYAGERLIAAQRADAAGNVEFEVPIVYGTNEYVMRMYGPTGEVEVERKRIEIPFAFLPPHELNYTVNAGSLSSGHYTFLQTQASYGINERMTNRLSVEYVGDTARNRPVFSDLFSFRLGQSILTSLDIAPSVRSTAEVQVILPSRIQYDVSATTYSEDPYYNSDLKKSKLQANGSIPIDLGVFQSSLRASISKTENSGSTLESLILGTSLSPGSWSATLQEQITKTHSGDLFISRSSLLTAGLIYGLPRKLIRSPSIGTLLLNASATYNQEARTVESFGCNLSASIFSVARCQIGVQRNTAENTTTASLMLTCDFDCMRTITTLQAGDNAVQSQTVSGALVYNRAEKSVEAFGKPWDGMTGAAFRLFLDANGNGICDDQETPVEGCTVRLAEATASQKSRAGIVTLWDLIPYQRYKAEITNVAIENNLWVPKQKTFSFIADPNTLKIIDVPFVAVGMIEGTIVRNINKRKEPVPGLNVVVQGLDNTNHFVIPLFQDGSLYYVGIPPGKYRIAVDSTQLSLLNCVSEPAQREFEIRTTSQGDEISGLDFLLEEKEMK